MKFFWSIAALLSLWAAATLATSCYYDDYQTLYGTGAACDTAAVSFTADIQPIVSAQCAGCHGAASPSGGLSLTNHAQIAATTSSGSMLNRVHLPAATPWPCRRRARYRLVKKLNCALGNAKVP